MIDIRLKLAGLWIALMLTYLLGDVIRIFAGDFSAGGMSGQPATQAMWLGAAALMLIPIVMLVLTLLVDHPSIRWVTVAAAAVLFLFNAFGLPGYPGLYDKALIAVGLVWNGLTIWLAISWRPLA